MLYRINSTNHNNITRAYSYAHRSGVGASIVAFQGFDSRTG